jgi:hypothetical protein
MYHDISNWIKSIYEDAILLGVMIGLVGKLSYEIYIKRVLSMFQWIAVIGMSVFSGYLTSLVCISYGLTTQTQILVPLGTLLGEKVFIYIMANYKRIFNAIFQLSGKKK